MEKLQSILNYSVGSFTVGKIFEAVIVFVICYFLIRIIMKVLKRVHLISCDFSANII